MKRVTVFILALLLSAPILAQNFLVLEKMGTKKRFEYHLNERMDIMLDNDDYFTRITLLGLADTTITAEGQVINFSRINAIKLNKSTGFLKRSGPILMVAGVLLIALDLINQTVVQGGGYEFSPGVYIASSSMIVVGTAFTFAGRDKVKLKKWWRLRTVDI